MTKKEENTNKYTLKIASSKVEKQLDQLSKKEYNRIRGKILELADVPRPYGVKKLSDKVHRVRIGDYRVIYSIFDKEKVILVDKIAKRDESTYKNI